MAASIARSPLMLSFERLLDRCGCDSPSARQRQMRVRKQCVASIDALRAAPHAPHRRPPAPQRTPILNVVMDQGKVVRQLHGRSHGQRTLPTAAARAGA